MRSVWYSSLWTSRRSRRWWCYGLRPRRKAGARVGGTSQGPCLPKVRGSTLAGLAVDRCSSGVLNPGPSTVRWPPPMHGGPVKSSPQLGAPKLGRHGVPGCFACWV